jgi:hypothetical protein
MVSHDPDRYDSPGRRRTILMCRPTYFDVCYSINPWMDPSRPTSGEAGLEQWK